MTPDQLRELVAVGYERRGVEFKTGGSRTQQPLFAKVTRAALGMSNRLDGGLVVIGVSEDGQHGLTITGIPAGDLPSWRHDDIAAGFAPYADPPIEFESEVVAVDGTNFRRFETSARIVDP
jgi:predicted HTH transcriptional regulator